LKTAVPVFGGLVGAAVGAAVGPVGAAVDVTPPPQPARSMPTPTKTGTSANLECMVNTTTALFEKPVKGF